MGFIRKHNGLAALVIAAFVVVGCGGVAVEPPSQTAQSGRTGGEVDALAVVERVTAVAGIKAQTARLEGMADLYLRAQATETARWTALARHLGSAPVGSQTAGDDSYHFAERNRLASLEPIADDSHDVAERSRFAALLPAIDGSWDEAEFRAMTNSAD